MRRVSCCGTIGLAWRQAELDAVVVSTVPVWDGFDERDEQVLHKLSGRNLLVLPGRYSRTPAVLLPDLSEMPFSPAAETARRILAGGGALRSGARAIIAAFLKGAYSSSIPFNSGRSIRQTRCFACSQ